LPIPKSLKVGLIRFLKIIKLGYVPLILPAGNMAIIGYKDNYRQDINIKWKVLEFLCDCIEGIGGKMNI
jgi:hypothetical protein